MAAIYSLRCISVETTVRNDCVNQVNENLNVRITNIHIRIASLNIGLPVDLQPQERFKMEG